MPNSALIPRRLLSDAGGLTQFGAFIETLPPGSRSSRKHWHEREDEFVYLISGTVVLHEGDKESVMRPGDAATFKAGVALGIAWRTAPMPRRPTWWWEPARQTTWCTIPTMTCT